jgi:16S rRNA processing protein RimM
VVVVTDDPRSTTLPLQRELWLRDPEGRVACRRIASLRPLRGAYLVRFDGVDDRESADPLRGLEVLVPRDLLPPLEEGELYMADLLGLAVYGPDGTALGEVVDVFEAGAAPVLEVKRGERTRQVPLAEPFVKEVDVPGGRLVLTLPDEEEEA